MLEALWYEQREALLDEAEAGLRSMVRTLFSRIGEVSATRATVCARPGPKGPVCRV